jgi:hypothetical protein
MVGVLLLTKISRKKSFPFSPTDLLILRTEANRIEEIASAGFDLK